MILLSATNNPEPIFKGYQGALNRCFLHGSHETPGPGLIILSKRDYHHSLPGLTVHYHGPHWQVHHKWQHEEVLLSVRHEPEPIVVLKSPV